MKIAKMGPRALALVVVGCVVHAHAWALSASDYKIVYSGADIPTSFKGAEPGNAGGYALVPGGITGPSGAFVSSDALLAKSNLPKDGEAGSFHLMDIDGAGRIAFNGPYVKSCFSCYVSKGSADFYGVMSSEGAVLFSQSWSDLSDPKYRSTNSPERVSFTASGGLLVSWLGDSYSSGRTVIYDSSFQSHVDVNGTTIAFNRAGQLLTQDSGYQTGGAPYSMLFNIRDLNTGERVNGGAFDPGLGYMRDINDLGQVLFYNDYSKVYTILQGPRAAVPEASALAMWAAAGLFAALCLRARCSPAI